MKVVQVCKYRNDTVEGVDLFEEVIRAAHGHDRSFYIFHGEAGNLGERLGCETVAFNFSKSDIKRIRPSAVLKVLRQLRRDKPDVIITHRMKPSVFVAWCGLFLPGVRKISVVHNMGEFKRPRRRLFAKLLMRGWKFAACSEAVRQDMLLRGFTPDEVVAIPNSVNEKIVRDNLLDREQARCDLGVPVDAPRVIGTVGRMRPVKGHKYLIDAMRRMDNPPHVVVIGDGELLESMREEAEQHGLADRLIFAGGRKNAYRYVSAFDAFIMPSLREGLPIAMLEAIAAGVPGYGTPVGGIPEILRDERWLFEKESTEAVKTVLEYLGSATPEQLEDTRREQYRIFNESFSIESYHARFRSLMEGGDGRL